MSPGKKYFEPTLSSLYRAKNPLAQYPEFQELRAAVAGLQRDSLEALRLEEESHVTVKYLSRQLKLAHRGLHMLTDIMVEELSSMKTNLAAKDAEIADLKARVAQVEGRQLEYGRWSQSAREDLVDIRRAVERELTHESQTLRHAMAKQARLLEELAVRVEAMQASREPPHAVREEAVRAAREEAGLAARRAASQAATAAAESLETQSRRLAGRIEQLDQRYERLESHVLELVDMLKTRALQGEADYGDGRSGYGGDAASLFDSGRRDSLPRSTVF